jgi:hypothetical protein
MEEVKVSLVASAVRYQLYRSFMESLCGTSIEYEVIFVGHNTPDDVADIKRDFKNFKYIHTSRIKPCQCYQVAMMAARGETVLWTADDAEAPNDVVGKAYRYWKNKNNDRLILSIQTKESGYNLPQGALFNMNLHRFFGGRINTPLMAPLGLMGNSFLKYLNYYDRRYVCGQSENDLVCRAYAQGGTVEIFGGQDCFIDIDHLGKSLMIGESKSENDFLKRPFAKGYHIDRQVLEGSWALNGKTVSAVQLDAFEPYEDKDILTKSQSNKLHWE